jgi:hypothetical protein
VEPVEQRHLAAGDGKVHLGGQHVEESSEGGAGMEGLVAPGNTCAKRATVQQRLLTNRYGAQFLSPCTSASIWIRIKYG